MESLPSNSLPNSPCIAEDTESTTFKPDGHSKSLADLPNEILLQILSYIDAHREERILGHIPDDPPPNPPDDYLIDDYIDSCTTLYNVALTCKRLLPLAQEQLFYAPVVATPGLGSSRSTCFLRTLLTNVRVGKHVRRLRVCLPFCEAAGVEIERSVAVEQVRDMIASNVPEELAKTWYLQSDVEFIRVLIAVVLVHMPHLERLCISQSTWSGPIELVRPREYMHNPFGLCSEDQPGSVLQGIQDLPATQSLTYLKVASLYPIMWTSTSLFPNLHTLDISTKLANLSSKAITSTSDYSDTWESLQSIHHLRFDFQVKTIGIWDVGARVCLSNMLRAFRNLKTLDCYAEPSYSKNPYRSVRAFPHYQMNIQNYPDRPLPLAPATYDQYWDQRIYDARTEITDYQNLVDIIHCKPQLKTLRLPGGFWTLPGGMRKPLPRFDCFAQLKKLTVPQAAILSIKLDNMRFDDVSGDFELSPAVALPLALQHLKVFDADTQLLESDWLVELFSEQREGEKWPELKKLEILFGPTYGDVELEDLIARRSRGRFWKQVDEASFEVVVGRDDEVPSVWL